MFITTGCRTLEVAIIAYSIQNTTLRLLDLKEYNF